MHYVFLLFGLVFLVLLVWGFRRFEIYKAEKQSNMSTKDDDVDAKDDSEGEHRFEESDNLGTRCDTESRGNAYFVSLFQKDPEPILFYFFNTEAQAIKALSEVSCIEVAKDSGKLISTKILTFGVFPAVEEDDHRTWAALIAGNNLTHDLWSEARDCFVANGGRMRREDNPHKSAKKQYQSGKQNLADTSGEVTFVRDINLANHGGIGTKKIYKAMSKESAIRYLKSKTISQAYYYIEIETPSGWVGKDKDGVYEF